MPLTLTNVNLGPSRAAATLHAGELSSRLHTTPRLSSRAGIQGVLLSIDGVMVSTRHHRIAAWQQLAEDLRFPFDPGLGSSLPSLPPMEALDQLLGPAARDIGPLEKGLFLDRHLHYFRSLIATLTPQDLSPGARLLVSHLRAAGVKVAALIGDAAARDLLTLLNISESFDAIFDTAMPDVESLQCALASMGVSAGHAVAITACDATLRASRRAGLRTLGIASHTAPFFMPDHLSPTLAAITLEHLDAIVAAPRH